MKGIDTSKWQAGKVDYKKAKEAGYEFIFLRIGYDKTKDFYFESDYTKAKAAGMKIGVYFYTTKTTENDGIADAKRVLSWLGNKKLDMPIAYDMEENSMKSLLRKNTNSKQYNAFADVVKAKGFVCMLYTGEHMFNTYFNKKLITDQLWIAKYSKDYNKIKEPKVGRVVAIHQYTSDAIPTDFYTKKLDRNIMNISYNELMKKTSSEKTVVSKNTTEKYTQKQFIKDIQSAIGVTVDGIVGKKTLGALPTVSKSINNRHKVIKVLQKYLNSLGYNCGAVDGVAGTKFDAAIKQYQLNVVKMKKPDGELTNNGTTWKHLLGVL